MSDFGKRMAANPAARGTGHGIPHTWKNGCPTDPACVSADDAKTEALDFGRLADELERAIAEGKSVAMLACWLADWHADAILAALRAAESDDTKRNATIAAVVDESAKGDWSRAQDYAIDFIEEAEARLKAKK